MLWSPLLSLITVVFFAAISSWFSLHFIIPLLRHYLLDLPSYRSSHLVPIPCGGGIVFVLITSAYSFIDFFSQYISFSIVLPFLVLPLALVGLLDDFRSLSPSLRLVVQLFTAFVVIYCSPLVHRSFDISATGFLFFLPFLLLLAILFAALVNFINFMDGLDGLVGGCMIIAISALSLSLGASHSMWALVGSLLGFLFWNWAPAKVFMGDVGSTYLGAVFAGLLLQSSSWSEAFCHLLVATPLLADAFVCLLRRLFSGQPVFQAHRLHLFQRLHQAGWSHSRISFVYIIATASLAIALLWGGFPFVLLVAAAELLVGVRLNQRFAVPFAVAMKN